MKLRVVLPIVLALAAGLGSLTVLDQVMNQKDGEAAVVQSRQVIVASKPLKPSETVTKEMVKISQLAVDLVPEEHYTEFEPVVGRVLASYVPAGWPVTPAHLQPENFHAGFESRIPKGYRAVAIKVDEWSSVSGFVIPGSRIDIIAPVLIPNTKIMKSKTILQNVEVAEIGSGTSRKDLQTEHGEARAPQGDRRTVILFLTPREVEILHQTDRRRLTLSLRSAADDSYVETEATIPPLAHIPLPVAKPQPKTETEQPEKWVTWIFRGKQPEQITYIRVNGKWHLQNSEGAYGRTRPADVDPMPGLKTSESAQAALDTKVANPEAAQSEPEKPQVGEVESKVDSR